jgi:hypothetical protein
VLLPGDDQREYEAFAAEVTMSWAPQDPLEQELVHLIIDAMWVRGSSESSPVPCGTS